MVIPAFKSEMEEAAWWEEHRATVEADLRAALRQKKTLSLQDVMAHARQKKNMLPVTIRLPQDDIEAARRLANDQGIGYQTYIKLLLHKALQDETSRAAQLK